MFCVASEYDPQGARYCARLRGSVYTTNCRFFGPLRSNFTNAVFLGEQCVIASETNIYAGVNSRAALTNNDVSSNNLLAAVDFDAKAFTFRIATVLSTTACFFMCHCSVPVSFITRDQTRASLILVFLGCRFLRSLSSWLPASSLPVFLAAAFFGAAFLEAAFLAAAFLAAGLSAASSAFLGAAFFVAAAVSRNLYLGKELAMRPWRR